MIVIHKPRLNLDDDVVKLTCRFQLNEEEKVLWYSFSPEYKDFIVEETLDAFVIGLLFLALRDGHDVHLKAPVSSKLLYSVKHYIINALILANPSFKRIHIYADEVKDIDFNKHKIAGTGLSCGVDSFATYYDHEREQEGFRIDYFTFFNAGSHGDRGGDKARTIYHSRLREAQKFADKVGKKIISVDSNISEILEMNFLQTNTLRNVSCVLTLQKLFRNYYVASKNRFDYFKLHADDNQDYDSLLLNLFSTESTTFFSSVSHLSRVERTAFISNFEDPPNFLDVCTNPNHTLRSKNCSSCEKCLRTALTLDLLGKLPLYEKVFDIPIYYKNKKKYIGRILATKEKDPFSWDIFELMENTGNSSYNYHLYSFRYKMLSFRTSVKKLVVQLKN